MANTQKHTRCTWPGTDATYIAYHDKEWGVPVYSERKLFEFLILEGAQAGLSWITILRKRPHYRKVFDRFNPELIARYNSRKINALLQDPGIVRNRLKVTAAVQNARAWLDLKETMRPRDFLWQFVDGEPVTNHWRSSKQVPANTPQSDAMSRELKRLGFKFVGTTICYAFMQATGMANDHTTDCFRHREIIKLNRSAQALS
jgi:DNA-3-methyladenine glycosylase I